MPILRTTHTSFRRNDSSFADGLDTVIFFYFIFYLFLFIYFFFGLFVCFCCCYVYLLLFAGVFVLFC